MRGALLVALALVCAAVVAFVWLRRNGPEALSVLIIETSISLWRVGSLGVGRLGVSCDGISDSPGSPRSGPCSRS